MSQQIKIFKVKLILNQKKKNQILSNQNFDQDKQRIYYKIYKQKKLKTLKILMN